MKCPACQVENRSKAVFCSNCGKRIAVIEEVPYEPHVKKVSIFFFTMLAYIAILHFSELITSFTAIILSDLLFILLITVFFVVHYKSVKPLLSFRNLKPLTIIVVLIVSFAAAFIVIQLSRVLNKNLFDKTETAYYEYYFESSYPLIFAIISIGMVPAVFEEIAFRGILFSELQMITTTPAVILITSLLFALLHFSVLSLIWLFPIALALGYLRAKYKTMAYGMLAHFTYNTSIVLLQYYVAVH